MLHSTIPGKRLQDADGDDFLVILVENNDKMVHRMLWRAWARYADWDMHLVIATPTTEGRFLFFGEHSLTAIAAARIDANTQWQMIPIHKPPQIV